MVRGESITSQSEARDGPEMSRLESLGLAKYVCSVILLVSERRFLSYQRFPRSLTPVPADVQVQYSTSEYPQFR